MARPKVLVFIDWYLPGYKAGGPVRSLANLVDHLRDRIDLHIVTADTDYTEPTPYPGIVPDRWTVLPGGERVWYASRAGTRRSTWKALLREQDWDAVYINGLYSWWYSILPLWLSRGRKAQRIVAVRGMLAEGALRHGTLKKLLFLSVARSLELYRNVRFQATNEEEARDIRRHIQRGADVRVVPNLSRKQPAASPAPIAKEAGTVRLVSVARIAVEKNTRFAIERLRSVRGQVTLDLYGPVYDQAYWAECRAAIAQLPPNVQVAHRGPVAAEAVPELLGTYHALFMPSAGENFGHTMLEALLAGRPLLISDRTPWRGLEAQHAGWDLPLDAPERYTATIEALCAMDDQAYAPWSMGALALGRARAHDPQALEGTLALFLPS